MFKTFTRDAIAHHSCFGKIRPGQSLSDTPMGFLDIGARGGAHDMVEPVASCTAVLGFEPDEAECTRLLANPEVTKPWARIEFEPVALADKKGVATLHLLSAATNHSLLPPNEAFTRRYNMVKWQVIGQEPLSTVKLDDMLFGKRAKEKFWGEFIKLDTQGTEYEILEGARKTLNERTVAIVCEVAFAELYKGQKLFSDVECMLREQGFSFYGFTSIHTRSQKLLDKRESATAERAIYSDAIFFKDPLPGGPKSVTLSPRQINVLFVSALLLNFYDFALELARATWLRDADAAENEAVTRLVLDLAQLPPETTLSALESLLEQAKAVPGLANVCAGNFVDRRRRLCDYDDVLNVSPLPKTL
jgi:FkbM family methyltransferase